MHDDEVDGGVDVARRLVARERPDLAHLPVRPVGGGTDNTMHRLGDDLVLRRPRTPGAAEALAKELTWRASSGRCTTCRCSARATRERSRGTAAATSRRNTAQVRDTLPEVAALVPDLDVDALAAAWADGVARGPSTAPHVWLHGDLKPSNTIVRDGRLVAVIDLGGLSVGLPDAEHAPAWDLPAPARAAYRDALGVGDDSWARARAWAVLVGASGVPYYWRSFPAFAAECVRRLRAVAADVGGPH